MALAHSPKIVTSGLVLCLDAANAKSYPGTGTAWTDLSGLGNNGTLEDGPTHSQSNGGYISFDGSNDRIHVPNATNQFTWTPSGVGSNNITIEFFVKSTDTTGQYISKPWNGNGEYNWRIEPTGFWTEASTTQQHNLSFSSLASSQWQHICAVINPTQKALYRNGSIYANFTDHSITGNTPTYGNINVPLCIMSLYPYGPSWAGSTGFSIVGDLSAVKIYNRVLSAAEIRQNFNALRGRYEL